jgi:hypothetical protein
VVQSYLMAHFQLFYESKLNVFEPHKILITPSSVDFELNASRLDEDEDEDEDEPPRKRGKRGSWRARRHSEEEDEAEYSRCSVSMTITPNWEKVYETAPAPTGEQTEGTKTKEGASKRSNKNR